MIMAEYDHHSRPTQPRDHHFQHLEHYSAPSTPSPPYHHAHLSFPQQQQSSSVRSTPTSYPSPASYPSPSMPAYNYLPQQGHHSPHFQQMNTSNYSLPPMRMTPPNTALPPPLISQQSGSPLPPPHPMYYTPHGLAAQPISHITSSPQPLRYPLPQERIMSGGRHKKEIKRRTKTGCLTCRKRRIKCDEAHPTCKNCAKSKRECMGYDPIFKAQPGPAAIQPAPSSAGPTQIPSSTSVPYGASNTTVGGMVYTSAMSTMEGSPTCETYDYPVDPLLEASAPIPAHPGAMSILAETSAAYRPDLKRTYDRASPLSCSDTPRPSTTPMGRSVTPNPPIVRDSPANPAKRIKIDDLLTGASNGLPLTPPSGDQPQQPVSMASDTDLYRTKHAATLLDALIETGWFTGNIDKVTRAAEQFEGLCARLQSRDTYVEEEDPSLGIFGGDAEVYLDSIKLLYGTRPPALQSQALGQEDDFTTPSEVAARDETIKRIAVVEALVTGGTKTIDLCSPQVSLKSSSQRLGYQTSEFWKPLARFVSLKEGKDREEDIVAALKDMKNNSRGFRVRELLCTIAEARHHYKKLQLPYHRTSEDRAKLKGIFKEKEDVMRNALATSTLDGSPVGQLIRRIYTRAAGTFIL